MSVVPVVLTSVQMTERAMRLAGLQPDVHAMLATAAASASSMSLGVTTAAEAGRRGRACG